MNISLTPQLEDLVKAKVASGLYGSASEVLREALCLLEERDRLQAIRFEELKAAIREGLESGEPTPLDMGVIKARGRKRLALCANVSETLPPTTFMPLFLCSSTNVLSKRNKPTGSLLLSKLIARPISNCRYFAITWRSSEGAIFFRSKGKPKARDIGKGDVDSTLSDRRRNSLLANNSVVFSNRWSILSCFVPNRISCSTTMAFNTRPNMSSIVSCGLMNRSLTNNSSISSQLFIELFSSLEHHRKTAQTVSFRFNVHRLYFQFMYN